MLLLRAVSVAAFGYAHSIQFLLRLLDFPSKLAHWSTSAAKRTEQKKPKENSALTEDNKMPITQLITIL